MNAPRPRDMDVIWIDFVAHHVTPAVAAHFKFISDLNANMASRAAKVADENTRLRAQIEATRNAIPHWTPQLKEAVIWRSRLGESERRSVLVAFSLSDEELDGWIARFDRFGINGLKSTALQRVGRS